MKRKRGKDPKLELLQLQIESKRANRRNDMTECAETKSQEKTLQKVDETEKQTLEDENQNTKSKATTVCSETKIDEETPNTKFEDNNNQSSGITTEFQTGDHNFENENEKRKKKKKKKQIKSDDMTQLLELNESNDLPPMGCKKTEDGMEDFESLITEGNPKRKKKQNTNSKATTVCSETKTDEETPNIKFEDNNNQSSGITTELQTGDHNFEDGHTHEKRKKKKKKKQIRSDDMTQLLELNESNELPPIGCKKTEDDMEDFESLIAEGNPKRKKKKKEKIKRRLDKTESTKDCLAESQHPTQTTHISLSNGTMQETTQNRNDENRKTNKEITTTETDFKTHADFHDSDENVNTCIDNNKFKFAIDGSTWTKISPQTVVYSNGRAARKMGTEWTNVFSEKTSNINAGCVLAFRTHRVKPLASRKRSAAPFLTATACCKGIACRAKYVFTIHEEPSENTECTVYCEVEGSVFHTSEEVNRRNVTGENRKILGSKMKTATLQHVESLISANEDEMKSGNFTSIPTHNVLRKIIAEEIKKETIHADFIRELQLLKEAYEKSNDPFIREISVDPFTLIMISDQQIQFMKKNDVDIYLDSTGGIISKIGNQKRPFLYSLVARPEKDVPEVSLGDMVTTEHNIPKLEYFLNTVRREVTMKGGQLKIRKIETDYSLALIQASMKAFSNTNLKAYLNTCSEVLKGPETDINIPIHHLCSSHMIQDFIRYLKKHCPHLKKHVRETAIKCFALMQNCSGLMEARALFRDVCCVFLATNKSDTFKNAFDNLRKKSKGIDIVEEIEEETSEDINITQHNIEDKTIKDSSPFTDVFANITNEVKSEVENEKCIATENEFSSEAVIQCFQKFMPIIPLWSGMMLRAKGIDKTRDSNSPAEEWFKVIKNDMALPQRSRPAKFAIALKKLVDGRFIEMRYPQCRLPKAPRGRKRKRTDAETLIVQEEVWQKKVAKTKRNKYHPPLKKLCKSDQRHITKSLPEVMSWGGRTDDVQLSNTCTIDNGLTILHIAFKSNKVFRNTIQRENDKQLNVELFDIFQLMDSGQYPEAKLTWINFAKTKPRTYLGEVTNLFGDEAEYFFHHLDLQWESHVSSTCNNRNCTLPYQQLRPAHGLGIGPTEATEFHSVQDILDDWTLSHSRCMEPKCVDVDSATYDQCDGRRDVRREVTKCSPVAVVRVYEHVLMERLTLQNILNCPELQIGERKYVMAGITMYKAGHYCAIVSFEGNFHWYDGLSGQLRALPKRLHRFFPSHAIYCIA